MKVYKIIFSEEANQDIQKLFDFIHLNYQAPLTAKKYINGLFSTFDLLSHSSHSYPIQQHKSFLKYGFDVRRASYKKMAIIFTLHHNTVFIHRIIASAMVV
jgi:plasmid stabilization system protein ParE